MLPADIRNLYEAYTEIYEEVDPITDDLIEEVVEELIEECVEFGYEIDEAAYAVEEAVMEYLDEAKVTYGSDTESPEQRKARAKAKVGEKRAAARKAAVKTAVGRAKAKAGGAVAAAGIAGSIAKDEARRAGRAAAHAVTSTVQKKKAEVKKGVKGLLKRGLSAVAGGAGRVAQASRKVGAAAGKAAERLGEEAQQLDEISDRKVQGMLAKREKQDRDSGGISAGYMANRRAQQAAARRNVRTGSNVKVDPILSKEEVDVFDLVLEYLLETGHAETISEAQYLMSQMDSDTIETIVEETTTERLARRASEKADEPGAKSDYKPQGPGFKNPRSRASIMNQIAGRAKTRAQHGVDSQYGEGTARHSEQPRRGGRSGRGSKTDRPGTANFPNPNRKPKG